MDGGGENVGEVVISISKVLSSVDRLLEDAEGVLINFGFDFGNFCFSIGINGPSGS